MIGRVIKSARWFHRLLIPWSVVLLLVALQSGVLLAAERFSITSDGVFSFDGKRYLAVGGVKFVQGETVIKADRLVYVSDDDHVLLEGNVVVTRGEEQVRGHSMRYHVDHGSASLTDAVVEIDIDISREVVHLLGERVDIEDDITTIYNARFTTCTPPETAGYYLLSRRIDVFPEDRIVIRNVRFVESGITLFYWPYLSISLRGSTPTRINLPEIGHSASDGWYARFRFPYDGPRDGYGTILVDVSQYGGIGGGVDHVYRDKPSSEGTISAYGLYNPRTDEQSVSATWNETFPINERLRAHYRMYGRIDGTSYGVDSRELEGTFNLRYSGGSSTTNLDVAGRTRSTGGGEWAAGARLTHNGTHFDWRLRSQLDLFRHVLAGQIVKNPLGYLVSGTRQFHGITVSLASERRVHSALLREGGSSTPAWRYFHRPFETDVTFNLKTLVGPRLPFEVVMGYGRFGEERRVTSGGPMYVPTVADRGTLILRTTPASLSMGSLGSLTFRAAAEHHMYSSGENRTIYTVNHQYRLSLSDRWTMYATYAYRRSMGDESPFRFDQVSDSERLTGRLQYYHPRGSISLSTGYNFITGRATDLLGQFTLRPGAGMALELQTGYSLIQNKPTYAAANVRLQPSDAVSLSASTRYSFDREEFDRIDGSVVLSYGGWRVEYATAYHGERKEFVRGDLGILRDLGCRQFGVRYDSTQGAVWFEYLITAFPDLPLRFGADREQLLFDTDPLWELFS